MIAKQNGGVRTRERRLADETLVQDEAEPVHIGLNRGALSLDPLGGDVHRGRVKLRRVRVLLRRSRDTKVADLRDVVGVEQDVRRL